MCPSENKTVAIFGGAFDPPTVAHREVISAVLEEKLSDEVWVLPTCLHMYGKKSEPFSARLAMCNLALVPGDNVKVMDVERQIVNGNSEYQGSTFELLLYLMANTSVKDFKIIVGLDNALSLDHWKYGDVISTVANFIVVPRPRYKHDPSAWYMTDKDDSGKPCHRYLADYKTSPISSTDIRSALYEWEDRSQKAPDILTTMLDPAVLDLIIKNRMYTKNKG